MRILSKDINENNLDLEFLITNGIGGYISSTILGINTRRYHGYLVASINPPSNRTLILSKVDETLTIDDKSYNLYSNMANFTTSDGYKYLKSVDIDDYITFNYEIEGVEIKKMVILDYMKNTTCFLYKIKNKTNKNAKLKITPIFNFRNFHHLNLNEIYIDKKVKDNFVELILDKNMYCPIYMNFDDGKFNNYNTTFDGMYYKCEDIRGFDCIENHAIVGSYELDIMPYENLENTLCVSLEKNIKNINVYDIINSKKIRLKKLKDNTKINIKKLYFLEDYNYDKNEDKKEKRSGKKLEKQIDKEKIRANENLNNILETLIRAIDNFIIFRNSNGYHSIIAGYPWFLDWGRDSYICFDGLLLKTKQYEIAKEVLLTFSKKIKQGLVPNGFSENNSDPLYNSVDSSLLFINAVSKYLDETSDYDFVYDKLYKKMKQIMKYYINGTNLDDNNIYMDKDYLLSSGTSNTQNTWMDAKAGGVCVTPRNGKAVEINALFYNSLKIMYDLSKKFNDEQVIYKQIYTNLKKNFIINFYDEKIKCLKDLTNDNKIRPNQLYSIALKNPIIDPTSKVAQNIIYVTEKKLLTPYGLRTLSPDDKSYIDKYEGDEISRDKSYHNGITWPYLLGLYYDSLKNMKNSFIAKRKNENQKLKEIKKNNVDINKSNNNEIINIQKNYDYYNNQVILLENKIKDFRVKTYKTFKKELNKGCIGQISEIYNSSKPYIQNGCFAQGWSVSEIFRIIIGA